MDYCWIRQGRESSVSCSSRYTAPTEGSLADEVSYLIHHSGSLMGYLDVEAGRWTSFFRGQCSLKAGAKGWALVSRRILCGAGKMVLGPHNGITQDSGWTQQGVLFHDASQAASSADNRQGSLEQSTKTCMTEFFSTDSQLDRRQRW